MGTKVVCGLILKNDRVLAALRKEPMSNAGYWELPGGKVKDNETEIDALKRELKEEFNIDAEVHQFFTENTFDYQTGSILLKAYWCYSKSNNFIPMEHERAVWLSSQDLFSINWTPADVPIVERLEMELSGRTEWDK